MNKSLTGWLSVTLAAALLLSSACAQETVSPWDAYAPVLQNVFFMLENPDSLEDIPGVMGIAEAAMAMGDGAGDGIGATLLDINGDDSPELLLGEISETDDSSARGSLLFSVFTLTDGAPQLVFEGWYRNRYDYLGNGTFLYRGSSSAAQSAFGTFHLNPGETQLTCDEFYFSDWTDDRFSELGYFMNSTGQSEPAVSTRLDVTGEQFWAMQDQRSELVQPVDLIPLSQLSVFSEQDVPIAASWIEEGVSSFDRIIIDSNDPQANILLTSSSELSNLTVLELSLKDVDNSGALSFDAAPVGESKSVLSPDSPLLVELTFPGDLPSYGIQFTQQDGSLRRFALTISGKDGSLLLLEADPECPDFVLSAGE